MNLARMRYFVSIAEHLSYSRAADALNISQSALSRQVQLFEADLGVKLFDRIGRRIALTNEGQDILRRCQSILNDVETLALRATELAGGSKGTLRIGATPQTLESVVARFMPSFRRSFPEIEIILVEGGSARLAQQLESGFLDLAIAGHETGSTLHGREMFPLCALAVVPAHSRFAGMPILDISELATEPLLLLRPHFMTRQIFDSACHAAGISPPVIMESASPNCLLAFVRAEIGTAIIPSTVILGEMTDHAIPLRREGKQLRFSVSVLWDPRRHMSPSAKEFVERIYAATRSDFPGKEFSSPAAAFEQ